MNKHKGIHISDSELVSHGCVNCLWKLHRQCKHNLKKDEIYDVIEVSSEEEIDSIKGICPEYLNHILSFAEEGDSVSAMWEKFNIYIARLQQMEDYKKLREIQQEIDELEKERYQDTDYLKKLEMKQMLLKMWWVRLNEMITKGLSRVVDREKKNDNPLMVEHKISLTQIHQITNEAKKQLGMKDEVQV